MDEKTSVQRSKKSRLLFALIAVILCAALVGGLWSAFRKKSVLPLTVSDTNYSFTVECADLDGEYVYLLLTVKALNEESRETLLSPHFGYGLGYFDLRVPDLEPREGYVFDQAHPGIGITTVNRLSQTTDSRTILLEPQLTAETDRLQVRLELMDEGVSITAPLTALPSVTLDIDTTGTWVPNMSKGELSSFRLRSLSLTTWGCTLSASLNTDAQPRLFFRLSDGSIRTSSQMLTPFRQVSGTPLYRCRFQERQDLKSITSVIVFDTEYPLDGSAPFPIEHDSALDPVIVPRGEPLMELEKYTYSDFPILLRPLMEALGGTYEEGPEPGQFTCTYREQTIVFDPQNQEVTLEGRTLSSVSLLYVGESPIPCFLQSIQDGEPVVSFSLIKNTWGLNGSVIRASSAPSSDTSSFGNWYIIP